MISHPSAPTGPASSRLLTRLRHTLGGLQTRDIVIVGALAALIVASWVPRARGPLDLRWDAGVYYVLGTALAEGKGYRLLNEPSEIAAIQYPPFLPAIVALHQLLLKSSDPVTVGWWLRLTFSLVSVLNAVAAWMLLRAHVRARYALLGALVVNTSSMWGDELGPEPMFMLASTLFVLCAAANPSRSAGWGAGVFAVIAYLLRATGIALLAAWVADSMLRRNVPSAVLRFTVALIPVLAWQGYIASVEGGDSYTHPAYPYQRAPYLYHNVSYVTNLALRDPFHPNMGTLTTSDAALRFFSNVTQIPASLGETVSAPRRYWDEGLTRVAQIPILRGLAVERWTTAIVTLFGALVVSGLVHQTLGRHYVTPVYVATYAVIVCSTPWVGNFHRYWAPLAPVLMASTLQFVAVLHRRPRRRLLAFNLGPGVAVIGILILALDLAGVIGMYRHAHQRVEHLDRDGRSVVYRLFFYADRFRAFDIGLDWLMQHARPTDIVATSMPHWVYTRTGLRAVMPPAEGDPRRLLSLLDAVPVTYVMIGGSGAVLWAYELAFPSVRNAPDAWRPVYSSSDGDVVIYRRVCG